MENVMLNSIQTQIKIVDFGLSNVWSADNPLRTHCGSPEYAAPELFVTGRQYGAEVDLWSLGIILYGMVMGQLPFVNARGDASSSQERRKKLVAQINRGLAAAHRRAIAPFSAEFKHMMNRLLVADSTKRMTTRELLVHPWITEKGRRLVRSSPFKILDSHWQAKIVTEIGTLLQTFPKSIMTSIAEEPLGKAGGMFNILVHKHQLSQLNGDGVTRATPSLTLLDASDSRRSPSRHGTALRISTARNANAKKPIISVECNRTTYCTPRPLPEPIKQDIKIQTPKNQVENQRAIRKDQSITVKIRPCTVQPNTTNQRGVYRVVDYRSIKSPNLRRKAYSANLTQKSVPLESPRVEKNTQMGLPPMPLAKLRPPTEEKGSRKSTYQDVPLLGRRGVVEAINALRKLPMNMTKRETEQKIRNPEPPRIRTANADRPHSKSDHLAGSKRPLTSAFQHSTQRPILKHVNSPSPVTNSQSTPTATRGNRSASRKPVPREKREAIAKPEHWEKSPLACGDALSRSAMTSKQGKSPVIYDPIARSIAGYVANNVPEKLHNFGWFKK